MKKHLVSTLILFLLLAACQTVATQTKDLVYITPSSQPRKIGEATLTRESKHPYEPSFTPLPTFTVEPTPMPDLMGTFSLIFAENPIPETAYFDFDSGGFNQILRENDIVAGLAIGTDIFLVIHPFGEARQLTDNKNGNLDFHYETCKGSYGRGGVPINPDLYYCWHTNNGHLVQFIVVLIEKGDLVHGWRANFKYVLWSQ